MNDISKLEIVPLLLLAKFSGLLNYKSKLGQVILAPEYHPLYDEDSMVVQIAELL